MLLPDIDLFHPHCAQALIRRFRDLGLTREFILRMTEPGDSLRAPLTPTREAQFLDDPAAILLRLFFCRITVPLTEAAQALGPELLASLLQTGFFHQPGPDHLISPLHLRLIRSLYLFSDYLTGPGGHPDAVMGAGETTAILFEAGRPKLPVSRALDLGCGAGALALLLSRHATQVIGTDINPRAVNLASFNAAANEITNVEFRLGDGFLPVTSERFDIILSQPPYYPNPVGGPVQTYLHGGPKGDELAFRLLTESPDHLTPQGRALFFASWSKDRAPVSLPDCHLFELTTNRREVHGTRQSLTAVQHATPGEAWTQTLEVSAERWGAITGAFLDQTFALETLLRNSPEALHSLALRIPPSLTAIHEDDQVFLQGAPPSLIGTLPIDSETWIILQSVHTAPTAGSLLRQSAATANIIYSALRRGLLTIAPSAGTAAS